MNPAEASGYASRAYAESLSEFGTPRELGRCGGWLIEREIPGVPWRDAMGPYPLFRCRDWSRLDDDLEALREELVSVTLVTDPFGPSDPARSGRFDRIRALKTHYVCDLGPPVEETASKHHRYYGRRALRELEIRVVEDPATRLDAWMEFYANLIRRHSIRGLRAFSRESFERQLRVPGLVAFSASHRGTPLGMHLWYASEDVAYSHLAASSEEGYARPTAYGLYWAALNHFRGRARWADLGGTAGTGDQTKDGLDFAKRGWSTGTRTAYLLGRILHPEQYRELAHRRAAEETDYFPAYRKGEFS